MAHTFSTIMSVLTMLGQGLIVLLLINLFFIKKKDLTKFFAKHAMFFSFIVSLIAVLGSLTYSDIIGYDPCKLCWFQRIFIYPIALITGMAYWKKEKAIRLYAVVLAAIGGLIALYHYLLQVGIVQGGECSVVGYSAGCSARFSLNFGYISIPMMALTACAMILTFFYIQKKAE